MEAYSSMEQFDYLLTELSTLEVLKLKYIEGDDYIFKIIDFSDNKLRKTIETIVKKTKGRYNYKWDDDFT